MNLIELLNHVGLENVTFQPIERDLKSVNMGKKDKCAWVTFGTQAITTGDIVTDNPNRKVGFVLWIPKNKLPPSVL